MKQWAIESDDRMPITLEMLYNYLYPLKVHGIHHTKCDYDQLLMATALILLFFTMSRPCELFPDKFGTNRGLRLSQIEWFKHKQPHFCRLEIPIYKNQQFRQTPKFIPFASARCANNSCNCRAFDPYSSLKHLLTRRAQLINEYKQCKKTLSKKKQRIFTSNHLWIKSDGSLFTVNSISSAIHTMRSMLNLSDQDAKRYTAYSFRIGGTTRADFAGISTAKLLKYVKWSDSNLPSINQRYTRFRDDQLAMVPFEMIHGRDGKASNARNKSEFVVFDPWKRDIKSK